MRRALLPLLLLVASTLAACGLDPHPPLSASPPVVLPGEQVVVTGARFGAQPGHVSLGGEELPAGSVAWHDERLVLTLAGHAPSGPLRVTLPGGAELQGPEVQVIAGLKAVPLASTTVQPGATLPAPFHVRLYDTGGRPVVGEPVTFAASDGATLSPATAPTDAHGIAASYLTLPAEPGRFDLTARVRCAASEERCYARAQLSYDTTEPKHYVLGTPLAFTYGDASLPGWLQLTDGGAGVTARLFTANRRPEGRNSLQPAQVTAPLGALAGHQPPAPDLTPTEVLVTYRRPPADGAGLGAAALMGAGTSEVTQLVEVPRGTDVGAVLQRLAGDPDVLHAEPNYRISLAPLPSDPMLHEQWGTFAVGAPVAWHTETGADGAIVVAIVDSGVDLAHPELAGRLLPGHDFCADDTPQCRGTDADPGAYAFGNWHGTHVAGIVAAGGGDGVGGVGVAPDVRLLPVKVFPDAPGGATTVATLVDAIRWAAGLPVAGAPLNPHPARVINLSLGGEFHSLHLERALAEVRAAGAVVVAATGNSSATKRRPVEFPAAAPGVIAVGALDEDLSRSAFSNHGVGEWGPGGVDLVAPGRRITSTVPLGWASLSGTSMATPFVAGAAALLLSQDPSRTPDDVERLLKASAYFDPARMDRSGYGAGLLRVDGALGLPAPTEPADRAVPVWLTAGGERAYGELDLLTGAGTVMRLEAFEPSALLEAALVWRGVAFGAQAVLP